jgi:signal transduction histidine kinase
VNLTARARLTLLLTGLVLAAGLVLTALTYLLMRENLRHRTYFAQLDPDGPSPAPVRPSEQDLQALADRVADDTLTTLLAGAGVALVAVTLLTAVLGWLLAGRILRPVRAIAATAQRLSAEKLTERVPVTRPADELSALADTVNGMLDRIQHGIAERDRVLDSQRLFTANAAHELRTPLTTARTAIEVTLDGDPARAELLTMAGDVRDAVVHVQLVLDGLLLLARSQAGVGTRETVDLADVAAAVLDAVGPRTQGLTVQSDLRPAQLGGVPVLLERMVGNLVDNAVRYNRPGGRLAVSTSNADGRSLVRVSNSGKQILPEQAESLAQPFVRGDRTRVQADGGLGLGLSIVRAVAQAHGGTATVTAGPDGGLDVVVELPCA